LEEIVGGMARDGITEVNFRFVEILCRFTPISDSLSFEKMVVSGVSGKVGVIRVVFELLVKN
jgi:hypothetical protein